MVVYVCRQDCVFDGLVPRRCVVGVGDCGVCVVIIYGRGEWCSWRCAILYGRGEWRGWVCYVWVVYDARCYVWLLMGCVGGFCRCAWLFQMSLYSMGGYHSLRQCRCLVSAHSCYAFFSWLSCHYEPRAVFLTFQGATKKSRCAAVLLVL